MFSLSVRDTLDKCNIKINTFKALIKCDEVLAPEISYPVYV